MIRAQTKAMECIYPHLGHSLKSLLEEKQMSQRELAARTALSSSYISSVIKGDRPISPGFACKLEQVFKISAEAIMYHQVKRDLEIIKEEDYDTVEKDTKILTKIMPIVEIFLRPELAPDQIDEEQIVLDLQRFFKVSSLANLPALYRARTYPEPPTTRANLYLLAAWALHCETLVDKVESDLTFCLEKIAADKYSLQRNLSQCKNTLELKQLLEPYGITLLFYHPYKGSIVNGFIKLTAKGNLALIVSSREKAGENLMPALRHLLGHIIYGDVSGTFIDFKTTKTPADKKADRW
jgi:HTH-type transcriptional regulator / antitoxin HigA